MQSAQPTDGKSRRVPASLRALRQMQRRLFSFDRTHIAPIADADLWRMLTELRSATILNLFRLWLVGSHLELESLSLDIDLVLSPRVGPSLSDVVVERALWHCRNFGLHSATPCCVIDPCFRRDGATLAVAPLPPDARIRTFKLLSPKLARLVRDGSIRQYRLAGRFSIEFERVAHETEYYQKLPQRMFDGAMSPYLRPAVEVRAIELPA